MVSTRCPLDAVIRYCACTYIATVDKICHRYFSLSDKRATKYNLDTCVTDGVCGKITGKLFGFYEF